MRWILFAAMGVLMACSVAAQDGVNRYGLPGAGKAVVAQDWRQVQGTNYNLTPIAVWNYGGQRGPQPFPAWKSIEGKVVKVLPEGLIVQNSYVVPVKSGRRLSGGGHTTQDGITVGTRDVKEPAVLVRNHPQQAKAFDGMAVDCFALGVGTFAFNGATVQAFDYGKPGQPPAPIAAKNEKIQKKDETQGRGDAKAQ